MKSIILVPLLFLFAGSLFSTTYYVSNAGNDGNNGLSLNTAFLTLQHAADIVSAGDSVLVADGTYTGFALWEGGTAQAPIVFQALGDHVLINEPCSTNDGINVENADYVVIDGFIVNDQPRNGIRLALADHCVVRNCRCDNNFERGIFTGFTDDILIEYNICSNSQDEHGIYVSNSSDRPIIRYNKCFGNNNIGIHMNGDLSAGGDGIISDAQVYGNIIHDNNLAAGINMDGLENPLVYNNLIYNNHTAQGIALFQQDGAIATRGAKIYHNTIIVPEDGRWGILVNTGSNVNTEIYNNIIINRHAWRGCISVESTQQFSSDYNILNDKVSDEGDGSAISLAAWQALGLDQHSQIADPLTVLFADPNSGDFHLAGPNVQAVDAGTDDPVASIVTVDIEGQARPNGSGYDVGAYEYQGAVALNAINNPLEITVYPNPVSDLLHISVRDLPNLHFEIYDLQGRLLQSGSVQNGNITCRNLPAGPFLLQLFDEQESLLNSRILINGR